MISHIRLFDIIKSIFSYKKFWLIWWNHRIIYVISKDRICDIIMSMWFLISKHLFRDITKYVEFLVDEMMTPVFYLCYFFYIPADTKFKARASIIFGSYHYSKEMKGKNDSWYHIINRFIYITKPKWFLMSQIQYMITQNQFFDITNSFVWYKKITMIFWYRKIYCVIS